MDFGVTGKLGGYYLAEQYRKNAAADKNGGVSFAELAAAKSRRGRNVLGMSFEEMMKGKYPEMKIHQVDASKIPSGIWCRTDFPLKSFLMIM